MGCNKGAGGTVNVKPLGVLLGALLGVLLGVWVAGCVTHRPLRHSGPVEVRQ